MGVNGLLFREDIIDTSYVEQIYLTPRNYLFQMNKLSDERSIDEQQKEKSTTPLITIEVIEDGTPDFDIEQLLRNEQGRVNKSMMTDMELCRLIDGFYIPWLKKRDDQTIYTCTPRERGNLFDMISRDLTRYANTRIDDKRTLVGRAGLSGKKVTEAQLRRCLIL